MANFSRTFLSFQEEAATCVGLTLDQARADDLARIRELVNQAVVELCGMRRWRHLRKRTTVSVSAAATEFTLPADFEAFEIDSRIWFPSGSGYGPLQSVSPEEIDALRVGGDTSGPPQLYALDGADATTLAPIVQIYPKCDANRTFTVTYRRKVTIMDDDADTPDLETALYPALETAVRIKARQQFNQTVPGEWEGLLERQVAKAGALLLPTMQKGGGLRDVVTPRRAFRESTYVELSSAWPAAELA